MKNLYSGGLILSPVLVILFMIDLHAQSFVYTANNLIGPNSVTAFSVAANGALTNIGTFATGGTGLGSGFFASNRARPCTVGNRLYVTNDGSNSVSGFDINPSTGSLTLVPGSPFGTGGVAGSGISLDCTPNGSFLIAAHAGSNSIRTFSIAAKMALAGNDAIAMFRIAANGALSLVPGSPFPFASPAFGTTTGVDINCASTFLYATQANFAGPTLMSSA